MTTARIGRAALPARISTVVLAVLLALGSQPGTTDAARTYTIDVATRSDWVGQTDFSQCVGASMQMMLNMIEPGRDRTARTQRRLQDLARGLSGPRPGGGERLGASILGWGAGLNRLGAGPYRVAAADSLEEALLIAASAIKQTGKPVGLLVWRGRHAWVMSGFRATGHLADGGRVTAAIVYDPLYPHGSKEWGRSPRPGEALTPTQLGRQFVERSRFSPWGSFGGGFVMLLPYNPDVRRAQAA